MTNQNVSIIKENDIIYELSLILKSRAWKVCGFVALSNSILLLRNENNN